MPVRFLSDAKFARLSGWPDEIAAEDLVTFFTLSPDDLPWLGWIPDAPPGCPTPRACSARQRPLDD